MNTTESKDLNTLLAIETYNGKLVIPSDKAASIVHFKMVKETTKENPMNVPVGTKPPSKYVLAPKILNDDITTNIDKLSTHIIDMLQDTREAILKESIISGATSMLTSELDITALIKYLDDNASTSDSAGKVSKELIGEWFSTYLEEPLTIAIAKKLGINDATSEDSILFKQLGDMVENYKSFFGKMAGIKISLTDDNIKSLEVALKIAGLTSTKADNDRITTFVFNKIAVIKDKPKADLLALDL